VRHARFVGDEGGEVHRLAGVVLGEGLHLAAMSARTLLGVEAHRAMPGRAELAMRLKIVTGHVCLTLFYGNVESRYHEYLLYRAPNPKGHFALESSIKGKGK
jgi:hypothetical protein